ncbi:MAG TPA: cupredoxin domain-containing protein, partial [Opitutus sp.]|nr:cupredoxin domain-containing protein [Opitutus sp.]
ENTNPHAVWEAGQTGVTRNGTTVEAKVMAIRSRFIPDKIEVNEGDTVVLHLTNVEQTTDMIHGWGLIEHDLNVIVDPGETKTVRFTASKPGVFAFYCTNFCSALHQEMQGYLAVRPAAQTAQR